MKFPDNAGAVEARDMTVRRADIVRPGALGRLANRVGWSIVRKLARDPRGYKLFRALGRCYGVRDIRVAGDYGVVEGSLQDTAILLTYARTRTWASGTNDFIARLLSRCERATYIDIGANIGLTTLPIAMNPRVSCKAFEPEPNNFRYLSGNVKANCIHRNVETFNTALFDRTDMLDFELSDTNFGDHRIRAGGTHTPGDGARTIITVQADRLDSILDAADLPSPIVVKIDTQGAEGQVFAGGPELLGKAIAIVFEFWPSSMTRMGGDLGFLTGFLVRHFDEGAIVVGEDERPPVWQAIGDVAERMRALMKADADKPQNYYDIYVRKRSAA